MKPAEIRPKAMNSVLNTGLYHEHLDIFHPKMQL